MVYKSELSPLASACYTQDIQITFITMDQGRSFIILLSPLILMFLTTA